MKIVIAGCGKLGFDLARQLSEEKHDVTVIDTNPAKLEKALAALDVQGVEGNGTSFRTQMEADVGSSDLMIAVTGADEVNLLCCLIAKRAGVKRTAARVRNPIYNEEVQFFSGQLGLSMTINPELACAQNIARLLEVPGALEITSFAKGRVDLIQVPVPEGSVLDGMSIIEFASKIMKGTLICAIRRDKDVIIPDGRTILRTGDDMYVIIPPSQIHKLLNRIGVKEKPIRNVIIAGGGTTAYYLAKRLEKDAMDVKIIERDKARAEYLSTLLPNTMIINGDASDRALLMEEGIADRDGFVTLTNMDEENMVLSMFAHKVGHAKTITKLNYVSFEEVVDDLPIGSIVSPKASTAKLILQYVRAMENSYGSNVETLTRILDGRVEVLEFAIKNESDVTGKPIMELSLKNGLLVCAILREGKIITPGGHDDIRVGDNVMIVTTNKGLKDIRDILQ